MSATTLIFAKKLNQTNTKGNHSYANYPHGYFKYEPFLIVIQIVVLLSVCILISAHAAKDLYYHTAFIKNYGWGFSYTVFTIIIDILMCIYIKAVCKRRNSALLSFQAVDWFAGLILTIGLLVGFLLSYYLEHSLNPILRHYAGYVDPCMTFLVVLFVVKEPISLLFEHTYDLLDKTRDETSLTAELKKIIENCAKQLNLKCNVSSITIRKAGRAFFIEVVYYTDPDVALSELVKFRRLTRDSVLEKHDNFFIHVTPNLPPD